jgi:exopolysaccharide biosynthesis polyprenyl glycosylphosphotransferase
VRQAGESVACPRSRRSLPLTAASVPSTPFSPAAPRPAPRSRPLIAVGGRAVVVWLAVAVIATAVRPLDTGGLLAVTLAAAIWLMSLRAASAGAPFTLGPRVPAAIGAFTGLVCVGAVNPLIADLRLPLTALLGMALGVFLSTATWDSVLERTARRRVLVVGSDAVEDIVTAASHLPRQLEIVDAAVRPAGNRAMPSAATLSDLAAVVEAQRPDYIVLTDDESCTEALERLLDMTDRRFRVASLTSFYEHVFGCVPLPYMTPMWFLSLLHVRQRMYRRPGKRLFDIVASSAGLVCAAPLFALLALLIKCTPGPVIYCQTRVGEGGRRFTIYKLRTMGVAAERPGEPVYARDGDPRVTGIGRLLRRTHLDELPQLWNVLKGDMSIVGPRPERPEFVSMLEKDVPYWSRRLLMRPGMTGWAQVRCGYASDCVTSAEKLSYDFWYMRHNCLAVDLAVCVRTLVLVLEILDPRGLALRRRAASEDAMR